MTEQWADVVGHEGRYEVSDHGRVRSLDRTIMTVRGPWSYKGQMLKPGMSSTGYVSVAVGRGNSVNVQYLVLEAFAGPRPDKYDADHINRIRSDNRLANLRWMDRGLNRLQRGRWADKHGEISCL